MGGGAVGEGVRGWSGGVVGWLSLGSVWLGMGVLVATGRVIIEGSRDW